MTRQEIFEFVHSRGGFISLKNGDETTPIAVFPEMIRFDSCCGTQGGEYQVWLIPDGYQWRIRYTQAETTRLLAPEELKTLLHSWLTRPRKEVFDNYQQ